VGILLALNELVLVSIPSQIGGRRVRNRNGKTLGMGFEPTIALDDPGIPPVT
jgi:hypothetical protein